MTTSGPDAVGPQAEQDSSRVRVWGWNCGEGRQGIDPADTVAVQYEQQRRQRRVRTYARLVMRDLGADPGRLVRAAGLTRAELEAKVAAGEDPNSARCLAYARGIQLAEIALDLVRQGGGDHDLLARERLIEQFDNEFNEAFGAGDPTRWDRIRLAARNNRWLRKRRKLSPLWWLRRVQARTLPLTHEETDDPAEFSTVEGHVPGVDGPVARMGYQLCHHCRYGLLCKISIDDEFQGVGLGARMVALAVGRGPCSAGYVWHTTPQFEESTGFWRTMAVRHRLTFEETGQACPHIDAKGSFRAAGE